MNSKLLTFLEEIEKTGNMSRAAQVLFVTQPYVSRVIKNAEEEYSVTLIDRSTHPIRLTYAGTRLLKYLQEEHHIILNLNKEMTHLSKFKYGHLAIGSSETVTNLFFTKLLTRFHEQYPDIHAHILHKSGNNIENELLSGELDYYIGERIINNKIHYDSIAPIELSILIPKTSSMYTSGKLYVGMNTVDFSDLVNESFITVSGDAIYHQSIVTFLKEHGLEVAPNIEVPNIGLATNLSVSGVGISFIPSQLMNAALHTQFTKSQLKAINIVKLPASWTTNGFGISYIDSQQNSEPSKKLREIAIRIGQEARK